MVKRQTRDDILRDADLSGRRSDAVLAVLVVIRQAPERVQNQTAETKKGPRDAALKWLDPGEGFTA